MNMRARIQLLDAQAALGFVVSQTAHIETEVNRQEYAELDYAQLVPIDSTAHPWAKTVTFYSSDQFGKAKWINGNADDIPMAGNELSKNENAIHMAGIGYGYGLEEISQAQWLGYNLTAEDAIAARRAYEEMCQRVAMVGDASKGFTGITNSTNVPVVEPENGDWLNPATTNDQILADLNAVVIQQFESTNYMQLMDTVLMPEKHWLALATRMIPGSVPMTLLQWFQMNNAYTAKTGRPLTIRTALGARTAGAGGTARLIGYRRSPQVVKMHIPMPHRFLPAFQSGPLRTDVPGIFRLGGVDVRRPMEMTYMDGI